MKISLRNTARRYGWVARVMHWSTVALVATMFIDISGLDVPPKNVHRDAIVAFHVSLGLVVLMLMIVRLWWRLTNPNPVQSYELSRRHRLTAMSIHRTMYVIVITLCVSGIAGVITRGDPLVFFGLAVTSAGTALPAAGLVLHDQLSTVLLILVAVHASAAVINQVFAGDQAAPP